MLNFFTLSVLKKSPLTEEIFLLRQNKNVKAMVNQAVSDITNNRRPIRKEEFEIVGDDFDFKGLIRGDIIVLRGFQITVLEIIRDGLGLIRIVGQRNLADE